MKCLRLFRRDREVRSVWRPASECTPAVEGLRVQGIKFRVWGLGLRLGRSVISQGGSSVRTFEGV